jgi:heparan-alpha-glucosaminide N-acetyltransferase
MAPVPARVASIDAYRGLVMFLLLAEALRLCAVAKAVPGSWFWEFLCFHQSHVEWIGCSLHDLIQPSFSFLVGVALPFSLTTRAARGQSRGAMTLHAFGRALVLVVLGIFLRSIGYRQTYFTFEDTLTQIGLGYGFLFLLGLRPARDQWLAFALILFGYWLAFACWPLPGADFPWTLAGVAPDWPHHLGGFAAHWNKNTNLAWAFDTWFLNLFPREKPFTANGGGYATLSFIPTLATMILGLLAGGLLRSEREPWRKVTLLAAGGVAGLLVGWLCGALGICPIVKRIWTPAWVLFSGGWCLLLLAAFSAIVDVIGWRRWAFPLIVIGTNSIAAYCMDWLCPAFFRQALERHLPAGFFAMFGDAYVPLVSGLCVVIVSWLILWWMYRRKIFLRI